MPADAKAPVKVLGIAGSLRAKSYNRMLLRVAQGLAPEGLLIEPFDIAPLPVYSGDLEASGAPDAVKQLWARVDASDAFLIVTPEYNFSIPGGLKNAIDWMSRDPSKKFAGKAAAIMGASPGMGGSVRAQWHLRQSLAFLDLHVVNKPEVLVGAAHTKFDAAGNFTDEAAKGFIAQLLVALRDWSRKIS